MTRSGLNLIGITKLFSVKCRRCGKEYREVFAEGVLGTRPRAGERFRLLGWRARS